MSWIINLFVTLLYVCLGMALFHRVISKPFVYISLKVLLACLIQTIIFFVLEDAKSTQFIIINIYQIIECVLVLLFYSSIFENRRVKIGIVIYAIFYFTTISLYLNKNGIDFKSFTLFVLEAPVIIFLSLFWFYSIIKRPKPKPMLKMPLFWVNTGHLMFYGPSLFGMGMYSYLIDSSPEAASMALISNKISNFILYTCYIIAFICFKKTRT